jgi:RNA polymerase sigma-70 factor (ECF subfamily)
MIGPEFPATLERARSGDELAWGTLYDDLAGPLLGFLRGRGAPDPEDQLGETFLQVARNLAGFEGDEAGFRSWVFTIAHRRLVDALRQRSRRPVSVLADEHLEPLIDAVERAPDEIAVAVERIAQAGLLEQLLAHLTDEQREVLVLRFAADMDATSVGVLTGRSTNAVAAITGRALTRLREVVAAGGPAASPARPGGR